MTRPGSSPTSGSSPTGRGEPGQDNPKDVDHELTDVRAGSLVEPVRREPARHDASQPSVDVALPGRRADQIRWGPVWAGLIVALATFLLLEVAFFALGWLNLDPGQNDPGSNAGIITGLIGLFAFFLGGLTAGATAMWHGVRTGLLHGIVVWALGVVSILGLALAGGSSLLGAFGDLATQVVDLNQLDPDVSSADVQSAVDSARDAASAGILALGLAIIASALGGLLGAKMWSGREAGDDVGRVHTD